MPAKKLQSEDDGDLPRYVAMVLDLVDQIPEGKVLGYGDVAGILGEGGPRQVGAVMARYGHLVNWHRVTYGNGRMAMTHEIEGTQRLKAEGVAFRKATSHGHPQVDMTQSRWAGPGSK